MAKGQGIIVSAPGKPKEEFKAQEKYESMLATFKEKDDSYQKTYKAYFDCIDKCLKGAEKPECIAVIGDTLCIISKKIVYKPKDGDIADVIWKVTDMDGKPPKEGPPGRRSSCRRSRGSSP